MDNMGGYVGGGRRYLPASVIRRMKENMKKTPIIQEKSEKYHKQEENLAEKELDKQLEENDLYINIKTNG